MAWVLFPWNSTTLENVGQGLGFPILETVFRTASPRGCHYKLDPRNEGEEDLMRGGKELAGTDGKSQGAESEREVGRG